MIWLLIFLFFSPSISRSADYIYKKVSSTQVDKVTTETLNKDVLLEERISHKSQRDYYLRLVQTEQDEMDKIDAILAQMQ